MKFCPQCGTAFEPEARFCLECGFDKSTVEPAATPIPEIHIYEPVTTPVIEPVVPESKPELKPACPQCGSKLAPGDRFCQECGFDTSSLLTTESEVDQIQQTTVAEEIPPVAIEVNEPDPQPVKQQFCPQCGTSFTPGNRFCLECGYDTIEEKTASESDFHPVEQPEVLFNTPSVSPIIEPSPPAPKPKQPEPPSPPPVSSKAYMPPVTSPETLPRKNGKKMWLWIVLLILGIGTLAAAGWFGYYNFKKVPDEKPIDSVANMGIPELPSIDTSTIYFDETEPEAEAVTEPPKTTSKPLSRMDKELAKQRAKNQNTPVPATTTTSQPLKPDPGVKVSPATTPKNYEIKVILEVGRKEEPKYKKPKNSTKLQIQKPTMIARITTDHYNGGMGTSGGGTITIKDHDGNIIGAFRASGKSGNKGAPNAKWVAQPNKMLEKGTYYIWDSDMATWSKNFVGNGFVLVEGYEVK